MANTILFVTLVLNLKVSSLKDFRRFNFKELVKVLFTNIRMEKDNLKKFTGT